MKNARKLFSVTISTIVAIMIVGGLLCFFKFYYQQDVYVTNANIHVTIKITNETGETKYGRGFFITKNRVVCLPAQDTDKYEAAIDAKGNEYTVVEKQVYTNLVVLKTDKVNENNVKYLYGFVSPNDIIKAHINDSRYISDISDCVVIDSNYKQDSVKYVLCKGKIKGKAGGVAIDERGCIVGMIIRDLSGGDVFFIYPQSEIMRKIIVSDLKDFFGIE